MKHWRHIAAVFAACLVMVLLVQPAEAVGGQQGAFTYELKGNGTAVITKFDWDKHTEGEDVYVPRMIDGYAVTGIGEHAFCESQRVSLLEVSYKYRKDYLEGEKVVVVLPDTLTTIGDFAFYQTRITGCMIPASVKQIGKGAFAGCIYMKQFTVASENKTYATIDGILYNKSSKELVAFPLSYGTLKVRIPEGIKSIGDYAFAYLSMDLSGYASNSYKIIIPSTLTVIKDYAFYGVGDTLNPPALEGSLSSIVEIGERAFSKSCIQLRSIMDNEALVAPKIVGAYAFSGYEGQKASRNQLRFMISFHNLEELGEGAFSNIEFRHDGTYRGSSAYDPMVLDLSAAQITCIESYVFSDIDTISIGKLKIVLPPTLKEIRHNAFEGFGELEISIPSSVKTIEDQAFKAIDLLTLSFESESKLTHIGCEAFYNTSFTNNEIELPVGLETLGEKAFHEGTPNRYYSNLATLVIPSTVASIGDEVVYRANVSLEVEPGSYAEIWASENGYPIITEDDTSWLSE